MKDLPWIIGLIGAVIYFAFFEGLALRHRERYNSLSRSIYKLGSEFPFTIFLMGAFAGGVAVHLFWHWCPALSPVGGG